MNKTLILLSVVTMFVTTTMISSCGKYEEGPSISLRSKKARVANEWVIEKFLMNGEDLTAFFLLGGSPVFTFDKDGTWKSTFDGDTEEGTWDFSSSKEELEITFKDSPGEVQKWTILKLKNKEMWVTFTEIDEDTDESIKNEIHFEAK